MTTQIHRFDFQHLIIASTVSTQLTFQVVLIVETLSPQTRYQNTFHKTEPFPHFQINKFSNFQIIIAPFSH
jgi:hypothetical protein